VIDWLTTEFSNSVALLVVVGALALIAAVEARADTVPLLCSGLMHTGDMSSNDTDELARQVLHGVKTAISMDIDITNNALTIDGFGSWHGHFIISPSGNEVWYFPAAGNSSLSGFFLNRVTGNMNFSVLQPRGKEYWGYLFDGICKPGKRLF
jgi:hypothetical protein